MKKIFLAIAGLLFIGQASFAQVTEIVSVSEEEIAYVQDPSQGYIYNPFKANWFIQAQGGAGVLFTHADSNMKFTNRITPAASLYFGKWFSPVMGLRLGVDWSMNKGLAEPGTALINPNSYEKGHYDQHYMHVGPVFDAMLNLTNWFCGYKPGRVYNISFYAGAGVYATLARQYTETGRTGYKNAKDIVLTGRLGLLNTFNISDRWAIQLDLRAQMFDNHVDEAKTNYNENAFKAEAYLGFTYNFGKTDWTAPLVPVCPPAENCDAYRAALAAAEAQIADLDAQLKACLNRPVEVVTEEIDNGPVATIYFPIGVSRLTSADRRVLNAVAQVMMANEGTDYVVTGWADNFTGTDRINANLRKNRAENVAKQLQKAGVKASQISTTTNETNLYGNDKKFVALDRCATINAVK